MATRIGKAFAWGMRLVADALTQLGGGNGGHSQDPSARKLYEEPEKYRP
ncbi:hypothetical protein AS850_12810 [Frondihabitans sp. 762G35]|nr:hypothetical protein [Frondihabitans sp. 762G35]ARC57958.1 hypothetical protein AS850_12810 [Frondihabitans sp. 762G35]